MKIALLRVGIGTGCGGIHGPLFKDNSFEYIPIPEYRVKDDCTYGTLMGRHGRPLVDYFPESRRPRMHGQSVHHDPEFSTFTYGDPALHKGSLRYHREGDILAFYCGLQGWNFKADPALYLIGYFEVKAAGKAGDFTEPKIRDFFAANFPKHRNRSAVPFSSSAWSVTRNAHRWDTEAVSLPQEPPILF